MSSHRKDHEEPRRLIGMTSVARSSIIVAFLLCALGTATAQSKAVPPPQIDEKLSNPKGDATAVVAGGCFWGVQAVFQHVRGVTRAVSGYAGGPASTAHYEMVATGRTGHAESVELTYDPSQITYGQLLRVFFSIAHDPTQLNRQGPDEGPQYRSAIFVAGAEQQRIAEAYIAQLDQAHAFPRPIATKLTALDRFYRAEDYHQDYATKHPRDPYILINDAPKVEHLRQAFPELYLSKR
jgi:peptide-methionine (S)-S-oxide reductase